MISEKELLSEDPVKYLSLADTIFLKEDENNNSMERANDIGTLNGACQITGTSKANIVDDDFFKFTAGADGIFAIVKEKSNGRLYNLRLFDSSGNFLASGGNSSAPELAFNVKKGQTYYIQFRPTSETDAVRSYSLLMLLEPEDSPSPGPAPTPPPTPPDSSPSAPTGLSVKVGDGTVTMDWNDCTDSDGISHYEIRYGTGGNYTVITATESWTFLQLDNGTYNWQVRAVDKLNNASQWVSGNSFTMNYDHRPDLFFDYLKTDSSSYDDCDIVKVSFCIGNQGNALAESTTLQITAGDAVQEITIPRIPLNFLQWYYGSVTFDAGEIGSGNILITAKVDPDNNLSEISESNNSTSCSITITAPPPDTESPTKPANLSYSQTGNILTLDWYDSSDNIGVAGYEYRYVGKFGGTKPNLDNAEIHITDWSSCTLRNLSTGSYYWQVRAFDKAGNYSSWSSTEIFSVTEVSIDPPSVPENLTCRVSGKSCYFDWADSTDNTEVAGYEFIWGDPEMAGHSPTAVVVTKSEYSKILSDGYYYWKVRAFDDEMNYSEWSDEKYFRVGTEPMPDLTFHQPEGWSGKIVLAVNGPGTVSSGNITVADYLFAQWGLINAGSGVALDFSTDFYLDGELIYTDENTGLFNSESAECTMPVLMDDLSAGKHTIKIVMDAANTVAETNENNNILEADFYVHDTITVANGETVANFYLPEEMKLQIQSGGMVTDTLIEATNEVNVQSGGRADNLQIFNGGKMIVSGETSGTSVDSGFLEVHSGGKVVSQELYSGSWMVLSGGTAQNTTMDWGNSLLVLDGGKAIDTTVGTHDKLIVSSGGTASDVTICDQGSMHIAQGGVLTGKVELSSNALITAAAGATVNFNLNGRTTADDVLINNFYMLGNSADFSITVSAGQAAGSYRLADGVMSFNKGIALCGLYGNYGTLNCTGGTIVYAGKRFSLSSANSSLLLNISENSGNAAQLSSGGRVVSAAGTLTGISLANGAVMKVYSGGLAANTPVFNRGSIILSSGGVAENTGVYGNGALHVYSGAAASGTTVYRNGYLGVGLGATTYDTTIDYAGELTVWGGGKVIGNTINTWGAIILSSGAMADSSVINSNGGLHVYSGAVASNTTVNRDGFFGVGLGATTYDTTIGYAGELKVWSGGVVHRNEINTWGAIILLDGAVANSTTVNANGGLHIYKGAAAYTTTVTSGAKLGIGLGGYLHGARLENNAEMTFYDGSKLGGWNDFAGSVKMAGKVNADGSYISLELQTRSADQGYLISNIGYFQNAGRFSVEVNSSQTGTYKLACGATNFNKSFTLYVDNVDRGQIGVGKKLNYNGIDYSLLKQGDNLLFNITNAASTAYGSITSGTINGMLA